MEYEVYFIHLPMKMELIEGSETSAISIVTPGNYPKENILHVSILFDGEDISFEARLVMYINSTNIPPIIILNKIYENKNLLYID